jgi:hypothetical protein
MHNRGRPGEGEMLPAPGGPSRRSGFQKIASGGLDDLDDAAAFFSDTARAFLNGMFGVEHVHAACRIGEGFVDSLSAKARFGNVNRHEPALPLIRESGNGEGNPGTRSHDERD